MPAASTVSRLLKQAEETLLAGGNELARRDAEIMLAHVLDCGISHLPLYDRALSQDQIERFESYVADRKTGKPVAYIIGEQEFWSLTFKVNEHTLVPRPDTETLVEVGLQNMPANKAVRFLDLGTGSGCILLSLLHERPLATGLGIDKSLGALDVARDNAAQLGLAERGQFTQGDWFEGMEAKGQFDLIVSNPPYIETADMKSLMPDVRDYEPLSALDGGADGLNCYRRIVAEAPAFLRSGGTVAVEVGKGQDRAVMDLFSAAGLVDVQVRADLAGINRVVFAKKA